MVCKSGGVLANASKNINEHYLFQSLLRLFIAIVDYGHIISIFHHSPST